MSGGQPRKGTTVQDRLYPRLVATPTGCHEWTGTTNTPGGYGRIFYNGAHMLTCKPSGMGPLTPENTYRTKRMGRICRDCKRDYQRAWRSAGR